MLTLQTLFQVNIIIILICTISTYPTIQKDGPHLQSIEGLRDQEKVTVPNVAATIEEVQKILQADSSLPRLTKGEIEDLFEQVTREEYEKSVNVGDVQRADNMRALMLVLPFNTENTTDEVLQELYTRPPVTKVIESYTSPQPQKVQSIQSAPLNSGKMEILQFGNLAATTYKPNFRQKDTINAKPTTYHPPKAIIKLNELHNLQQIRDVGVPVTSLPLLPDIEEEARKATRFSSSYNAKETDWSLLEGELNNRININKKSTPMHDLAGIFKTMGLEQPPKYLKEKLTKLSISSSIPQSSLENVDTADFTRTLPPQPNLEAYSEFKPLNIGEEIRVQPDIENYLNRFGIVKRKRKQIKPEDNGFKNSSKTAIVKQQILRRSDTNVDEFQTTSIKNNKDELSKLLNNIQELQRLNISLNNAMFKPKSNSIILEQGPDPVFDDEESKKNDLKRQSANNSLDLESLFTTESTPNSSVDMDGSNDLTTTTISSSAKDEEKMSVKEPQNGSLADLEDSFGGPDPITEDPSPPPKKNGFYFLADWNSFLEVGEAGGDQVVVRFDPKIGDPRRFLKVTVP